MKTSRRPLLDTILNPSGLAATVRNNEVRVQKIERAPVKFNFNKPNPPKKAPKVDPSVVEQPSPAEIHLSVTAVYRHDGVHDDATSRVATADGVVLIFVEAAADWPPAALVLTDWTNEVQFDYDPGFATSSPPEEIFNSNVIFSKAYSLGDTVSHFPDAALLSDNSGVSGLGIDTAYAIYVDNAELPSVAADSVGLFSDTAIPVTGWPADDPEDLIVSVAGAVGITGLALTSTTLEEYSTLAALGSGRDLDADGMHTTSWSWATTSINFLLALTVELAKS